MDNIKRHMDLMKLLKLNETRPVRDEILRQHEPDIMKGYEALEDDIVAVLEKHMPMIIDRDQMLDRAVAQAEGRDVATRDTIFMMLTAPFLARRLEYMLNSWVVKKIASEKGSSK